MSTTLPNISWSVFLNIIMVWKVTVSSQWGGDCHTYFLLLALYSTSDPRPHDVGKMYGSWCCPPWRGAGWGCPGPTACPTPPSSPTSPCLLHCSLGTGGGPQGGRRCHSRGEFTRSSSHWRQQTRGWRRPGSSHYLPGESGDTGSWSQVALVTLYCYTQTRWQMILGLFKHIPTTFLSFHLLDNIVIIYN